MNELFTDANYRDFIETHVVLNQSSLVDRLLQDEDSGLSYDNVINPYDEEDEFQEVYEWWVVHPWLLAELEERGEPVLRSHLGNWWGRCATGQACKMDDVLQRIWKETRAT